jgi:hypothetical protein
MSIVRMGTGMRLGLKFLVNSKKSGSDEAKEHKKNYHVNIFGYVGQDPWHTR